ncbi:MAG: rRNA maturation RNase YbeY [Deltaproteobacteria bacterium]|jgi:probable rRNA maturation factor|nr:rRNA maturation RNase YbeY [Deltaproteobacteria bacterium]MBT4266398.1 rRNA maturation RNase YbeY [Deltaproteobacteria bacterium]MBT4643918.1 rRNA maturation RNase YbeY [Deltaproteobacteria bacterium]MBT6499910.1 rRNA maturation RNase YbeY [Deltaproteobacteria bacterium]MBT6610894.1 rRNA maturation RNase YbeY [Deltaproteobacteria bacterium]
MENEHIQITYELPSETLPLQTEKRIMDVLGLLMMKLGLNCRILSLFFCSVETMIQLNGTYRSQEKPTDLLSWLYQDVEAELITPDEPWGELVYCLELIRKQATESGWELEDELLRLTVHGLTHLLGYDHEDEADEAVMLAFEKDLLEQIGLTGVYES